MVITISGPSGSGKSTILRKIAEMTKADIVPTVTTRERRPKEKVSDDRIFVSKDDFKQMIENGEFVEWKQQKNGHYYGRRFSDFKDVSIVDVSLKGSREYKSKFPNSFSIFLKPNVSAKVLASHMRKRGGMSEAERKGRADIIERLLESASKMDFDLVVTSRAGEYEKVAEEIIPQIPLLNPKKYQSQASVIISRSTKKDKKLMAMFNFPDGRRKTTHFGGKGYSDYTIHKDKARKKRYDTRHARREDWEDFTTAGALSKWILWNKPSLIDSFNHYKAMFSLDGAITVQTSQAGKIPASRNPPVKLVSRTGTDDNVSRFFNKKTGEELTGKVFDSATIDTKDGTSLEVGKEIDPVELVGVKRQYNVGKLNDRTVIQVGNGTNRLFEKIDFKLPVHLEYDPMSLGEPSAFITTRGVLIFDESEDNYTLVKRSEVTDFKGVSKTDSPMLVPLYKYAKVVKRTPGIHGGPVENPPLTYDLTSMVTPRHLKRVNDRLFPQKMKSWDKKPDKEKERLITRSEEFRRDLEYAYGWKGRTAKTAIEAILSDYAKSFDKNGYAKVYRGLITLPSENLKEAWDKYGVGKSWSSYKEGADDYVWTPVSGIPGAVLVLVEGRVHVEDVSQTDRQLSLRIGFPLEKEIQIVDRVEVTKYSMWRIDPEDRVKKPKWETTGKNWKPWLRRGVKPISVVEVNQTFPAHTSESEPTPFLPNPNQDYYAIIDGEPIYSNPSKTPEGRKIPKRYLKGLNKEEMIIAAKEIDKGYKYDIDDPKAYEFWKSDIKATARGYKTVPSKYKKKFIEMYGPLPEEGEFLDKMAKATKIKKSILEKVYDKGLAAWRGGHRPGVQQHQWAAGRVYSFVTLGNTVMKDGKRMSDHSLAVEAGLIKENPSHCPIEAEARRAATDPSFKHHKWYVKHHLDYVMALMRRMPKVMGNWNREMVDMVWMHDYPKMMGKSQDLSVVNDLLTTHRGEDYAHKIVHQLHLMERLKKPDWNPLTEYSMVAANLSTADALAHYYGPFFQIYIDENPDMSMEEIKKSNRQKLAKDKLKLRAGPMKDGLDSIKFQYKVPIQRTQSQDSR
jgi:guanylate kinase